MNNNLAENLKKIRKENNLSQEELAESLGVSRQAISKWESSQAYPEMDKIIALCDKFNLNIDDLLHHDIKEIKGEEESKKKLNEYADDFLNFITDTINLLSNMNFKSKLKFFFEECLIIITLIIILAIILNFGNYFLHDVLSFLPLKVSHPLTSIFNSLILLSLLIISLIIVIHIFKTRYLNYYNKIKKSSDEYENKNKTENLTTNNKIIFQENENKIIIRDPKDSEYHFLNSLFKFIIGIIKFFTLCFTLFLCFILVLFFCCFTLSFLVIKTGAFFIGLIGSIFSSSLILIIAISILLNFIFNRKNNKKLFIHSFIVSLIFLGLSFGLIFLGTLNFEVIKDPNLKTEKLTFSMEDNLFFLPYNNITYIEKDISNVEVECQISKFYKLTTSQHSFTNVNLKSQGLDFYLSENNPLYMINYLITNINQKKIVIPTSEITTLKVYASKENIAKLKVNQNSYLNYFGE